MTDSPTLTPVEPARRGRPAEAMRILYVDEDADAVADLVRAVADREFWEVAHAKSADDARRIAQKQPLDIALLSATMPDLNVAALADELMKLYPKITIFIMSPEADGAGAAYASGRFQWLPKPCPGLVSAVERMAALVSWLTNNTTLELVSGLHSLPTIPSNYQGVIRAIHSPHSSVQEIGDAVSKDMGITSRVLQVANSAYYGYSKKITNSTEAAMLLGVDTMKSLVRYTHVLNNFPQTPSTNAIFDAVWRHSSGVAAIARKITLLHTADENMAEEAFTAGLLHDIGKVVLTSIKPAEYKETIRQAAETKSPIHLIERVRLKTTHAETGAYLLSLWGIPFPILEAVAWHHYPTECRKKEFSALTAVHVANVAEHLRHWDQEQRKAPDLDERYLTELGLLKEAQAWLKLAPDKPRSESTVPLKPYVPAPANLSAYGKKTPAWIWPLVATAAGVIVALILIALSSQ